MGKQMFYKVNVIAEWDGVVLASSYEVADRKARRLLKYQEPQTIEIFECDEEGRQILTPEEIETYGGRNS